MKRQEGFREENTEFLTIKVPGKCTYGGVVVHQ